MSAITSTPGVHHIGVQTPDLANSTAWYQDFFGAEPTWTTDRFSALTSSRLPGVTRLTELALGDFRFHLFERPSDPGSEESIRFQHVCMTVETPQALTAWREKWIRLYESRRYRHLRPDQPTDIVVDDEGNQSFYCFDVNGLEFEFTWLPGGDT